MRIASVAVFSALAAPTKPVFPQQWSAMETDDVEINQGGEAMPNGNLCCTPDSPQCKIQTAHGSNNFYFDYTNNRTRSGGPGAQSAIVSDYKVGKEMQVSSNNTCTEYCPLQFDLGPFGMDKDAKYVGTDTVAGQAVDVWSWTEYIIPKLHLLPMEKVNFYVSQASDGTQVPVREMVIMEPLGQQLGVENSTWANFVPGAPEASMFKVVGEAGCPMSPNCNQNARKRHRHHGQDHRNAVAYDHPEILIEARRKGSTLV